MKSVDTWLEQYGESHQNPVNKTIHWICIPLIVVSLLGLLAAIPTPLASLAWTPHLHVGTIAIALAVVYYFALSPRLAFGMALFGVASLLVVAILAALPVPLWISSLTIFVGAWIGQFVGHKIEGKKPSFFEDLQFLMIGPMWLLADLYRRMGLSY